MYKKVVLILCVSFFAVSCAKIIRKEVEMPYKKIKSINTYEETGVVLCFSNDNNLLVAGSKNGNIIVYETKKWKRIKDFSAQQLEIKDIKFSNDDRIMFSVGEIGTVNIWDTVTWELKVVLDEHMKSALCADFHPKKQWLVVGAMDGSIIVWDTERWSQIKAVVEYDNLWVKQLAFTNDGNQLFSMKQTGELKSWDTDTWSKTGQISMIDIVQFANNPIEKTTFLVIDKVPYPVIDIIKTNSEEQWDFLGQYKNLNKNINKIGFLHNGSFFVLTDENILLEKNNNWIELVSTVSIESGKLVSAAVSKNGLMAYASNTGIINIIKIKMNDKKYY